MAKPGQTFLDATDTLTVTSGSGRAYVNMDPKGPDRGEIYTQDSSNNLSGLKGIGPHETGHLMGLKEMSVPGEKVAYVPGPQGIIMKHAQPGNRPATAYMVLREQNFNTTITRIPTIPIFY